MLKQRLLSVFLYAITAMTLSSTSIAASLDQQVEAIYDDQLSDLFVWFHQNPELSFMEQKTSARLAEELTDLGFEVHAGIAGTGIVALLKNGEGPLVMLRADMDGLPVPEKSGLAYASTATQID